MDTLSLLEVVKTCNAKSPEQAQEVIDLKLKYPYSQVLHALSAKLSQDFKLEIQKRELQHAAVYSSDRVVLKDVMSGELCEEAPMVAAISTPSIVDTIAVGRPEPVDPVITQQQEQVVVSAEEVDPIPAGMDVADALMRDLEKLYQSKHNFEMLFASDGTLNATAFDGVADLTNEPKTKKEKIREIAKAVSIQPATPTPRKRRASPQDHIIEEIKSSKEEIEPESERQREQIQIIEHFIKTQPSISNPKEKLETPPQDLNSIKSGEFGDNIISETLVEILLKQGKKERAIEVLKKLIWKYPQKKAYFASQIEELKK